MSLDQYPPIPLEIGVNGSTRPNGSVDGWRDIESETFIRVEDNGEPLVEPDIVGRPAYTTSYGDHQFVRQTVADRLVQAQQLLPDGMQLVLFDGWRSLDTQMEIFQQEYAVQLAHLRSKGALASDETPTGELLDWLLAETQKYVSLPSPLPPGLDYDPVATERARQIPSPHNTGGAVDVAIMRDGVLLDFGTGHDHMSPQSGLTYCETNDSLGRLARINRRMLYYVMTQVGFEPYAEEWWHFNFGNQMAQMTRFYRTGDRQPALYANSDPRLPK